MKDNYPCPKCESTDVIEIKGSSMQTNSKIPATKWGMTQFIVDRFICYHCGFTEEYIRRNTNFLKKGKEMLRKQRGNNDEYV